MINPADLVPQPESIPAPAILFQVLDNALFLIHIVLVNIVVGGSLITLFSKPAAASPRPGPLAGILSGKLPLFLPYAITLGVAPLLFLQVVYGHFFYSSSILMAVFWIAVIPALILAYYGLYLHRRLEEGAPAAARLLLGLATVLLLGIGFIYVNNLTLMVQPEKWVAYFKQRGGTLLNLGDPSLAPRYLHFLVASVAVAGLAMAIFWSRRASLDGEVREQRVKSGLRIFAVATLVQIFIGAWFLLALPKPVAKGFMGGNLFYTIALALGALSGIGAMATAFSGKLRPTLSQLVIALVAMVVARDGLRAFYLKPYFSPDTLQLAPQYDVLVLFLAVLLGGLAAMVYMIQVAFKPAGKGGAQ